MLDIDLEAKEQSLIHLGMSLHDIETVTVQYCDIDHCADKSGTNI